MSGFAVRVDGNITGIRLDHPDGILVEGTDLEVCKETRPRSQPAKGDDGDIHWMAWRDRAERAERERDEARRQRDESDDMRAQANEERDAAYADAARLRKALAEIKARCESAKISDVDTAATNDAWAISQQALDGGQDA